jgi:hypothetical protein
MSIGIIFFQETSKGDEAVVGDPDFLGYYPMMSRVILKSGALQEKS